MNKKEIIVVLQSQIGFEKERDIPQYNKDTKGKWNKEYMDGYIDGLKQAINCIKEI